jgi:hypothetical protein
MDIAGTGYAARVRIARYGDDAWADVLAGGAITSTTRLGAWRDGATVEARDVDGDGRADLVRRLVEDGKRMTEIWLSDGRAFVPATRQAGATRSPTSTAGSPSARGRPSS